MSLIPLNHYLLTETSRSSAATFSSSLPCSSHSCALQGMTFVVFWQTLIFPSGNTANTIVPYHELLTAWHLLFSPRQKLNCSVADGDCSGSEFHIGGWPLVSWPSVEHNHGGAHRGGEVRKVGRPRSRQKNKEITGVKLCKYLRTEHGRGKYLQRCMQTR